MIILPLLYNFLDKNDKLDLLEVCEPFDMTGGDLDGGGNDSDEEYLRNKKVLKLFK